MNQTAGYVFVLLGVHISFAISALAYACKYCDRNSLFGARTPYAMSNDRNWRLVNDRVARLVPPISAVCGLVALSGFWIAALRSLGVFLILAGVQVIALILAATVKIGGKCFAYFE